MNVHLQFVFLYIVKSDLGIVQVGSINFMSSCTFIQGEDNNCISAHYVKFVGFSFRSLLMECPDIVVATPSVLLGHVQAKVSVFIY